MALPYDSNAANQLDYVYKSGAVGVVKTDDLTKSRIIPLNEQSYTTALTFSDNIWTESHKLYAGAAAALQVASEYNKPYKIAKTGALTKLTSRWGVGAPQGQNANPLLAGQTWVSNKTNWIPPLFDQKQGSYDIVLYAAPQGTAASDVVAGTALGKVISPLGSNYVFDYATGILTFIGAPGLVGPDAWNLLDTETAGGKVVTKYDIYIGQGYIYTGGTLTNFSGGVGGGSSSGNGGGLEYTQDDLDMIRNVGRRAWIEGATGTLTYDQASNTVDHEMVFFGNSSHYTSVFGYSSIASVNTPDTTLEWSGKDGPVSKPPIDGIWNNNRDLNNGYPHDVAPLGKVTLVQPPSTEVTTSLPVVINTFVSGGTGTVAPYYGGSMFYLTLPLRLLPADAMPPPMFVDYLPWVRPTQVSGSTLVIDSIQYFTTGAQLVVSQRLSGASYGFKVMNMYNVIKPNPFDKDTFSYITFSTGDNDKIAKLFITRNGQMFDVSNALLTDIYTNTDSILLNINNVTVGARLTNLKGVSTPSTGFSKIYPIPNSGTNHVTTSLGHTHVGTQMFIGYVAAVPETAGIKVGLTIAGACNVVYKDFKAVRMSNADVANPATPALSNILPYDINTITGNDPVYMPFTQAGYLCAGDFVNGSTTGNLKYDYILPPQTLPTLGGIKYQVIKVGTNSAFQLFDIIVAPEPSAGGPEAYVLGVQSINVYWDLDAPVNNPNKKWYNYNINFTDPGGCGNGGGVNFYTIKYQAADWENYVNSYTTGVNGTMYICIGYSGVIKLTDISVGK